MDYQIEANRDELAEAVIGHKIVTVEKLKAQGWEEDGVKLTLDNGKAVHMRGTSDCCAGGWIDEFLFNEKLADHIITDVRVENDETTWFVLADMAEVLKLDTGWSEGSGYYSYGFSISVEDA